MGQFANVLFSLLLGWVQTAASWLWSLATNADVSAWLTWMLDHWLALALLLCLTCATVDFVVYLLRWQPYRVWRNGLLRHRRQEDAAADDGESPVFRRTWLYADGTTAVEEVPNRVEVPEPPANDHLEEPIRPTRRMVRRASPEQAYNQPFYPPQWQHNTQDMQGENE